MLKTPNPLPLWWLNACRYRFGLIHVRPNAPKPIPKWCLEQWALFEKWSKWVDGGRKPPRPKVWESVPQWAWLLRKELIAHHARPPGEPPPPPPPPPPTQKPSWTLPGPFVMTASDPDSANNHKGVGTIGKIIEPGVCPLWECYPVGGGARGLCGQIEGWDQLQVAIDLIQKHRRPGDHLAIVSTLNVSAVRMLEIGVNVCFYEMNAQAGWEPYGNQARMEYTAHKDGWLYCYPSYGVYIPVSLVEYFEYIPMVWDYTINDFVRGTKPQGHPDKQFAIFSAEGTGDTSSWPTLANI